MLRYQITGTEPGADASVYAETDGEALVKIAGLEARGFSVEIIDMRTYKVIALSQLGQRAPRKKPTALDA